MAAHLPDDRRQSEVTHFLEELFRQRLFAIARGYADDNAAARPADDPVMKLLSGRDPLSDGSLASQPTLWRLENVARARDLLRLSEALTRTDRMPAATLRTIYSTIPNRRAYFDTLPLDMYPYVGRTR